MLKNLIVITILAVVTSIAAAQETGKQTAATEKEIQAIKSQLPPAPDGFTWQLYKNAVFLKPDQWTELHMTPAGPGIPVNTYATSPEKFNASKPFEMGF